ncbi:MAG: hypothetical protein AB7S44_02365 [Spirochaetales bacterium]
MTKFANDFTKLVWENFEATGKVGLFMLYFALQYPEKVAYRLGSEFETIEDIKEL